MLKENKTENLENVLVECMGMIDDQTKTKMLSVNDWKELLSPKLHDVFIRQ